MTLLFDGDTDPTPAEGMVTVGRFESPIEAQMARGMLESAGVQCQMVGENVSSLLSAAFRVRLQVLEEDEAAARELIRRASESVDQQPDRNVQT